jgi:ribosomal 50S subunit-associated protein YjgA (DUF615 family)
MTDDGYRLGKAVELAHELKHSLALAQKVWINVAARNQQRIVVRLIRRKDSAVYVNALARIDKIHALD